MEHAKFIIDKNIDYWIFTDECIIQMFCNKQKQWIRKGRRQRITQPYTFREGIMIWDGISKRGKTKIWINENRESVKKEKYFRIINKYAVPFINRYYDRNALILHDEHLLIRQIILRKNLEIFRSS